MSQEEFDESAIYELESESVRGLIEHFQLNFHPGDLPVELHPRCRISDLPYLVHTGRELALMLEGKKPLAVFVDEHPCGQGGSVIPEAVFEPHVIAGRILKREVIVPSDPGAPVRHRKAVGLGRVLYALSPEAWRIDAYLLLWSTAEKSGWNAGFERMEGSLLGYEDWQNDLHIENRYPRRDGQPRSDE